MSRKTRKLDHVRYALELADTYAATSGFEDLFLVHNALPELNDDAIDCSCVFMGKRLRAPLMINAITGGHTRLVEINQGLARAAAATGIAMAVGSQQAALDDPLVRHTFTVAREENPDGLLLANLSAQCSVDEALQAVEMICADGIQLHLNVNQELAMHEGDTDFRGVRDNIERLVKSLPVPVVVKEVGFGMAREVVVALYQAGVRYVDVSGWGGTNFAAIEGKRGGKGGAFLERWGIPTAISLLEALSTGLPVTIIASGGLRTPLDMALALAAGASLTAIAGPFLKELVEKGWDGLVCYINDLISGLRQVMMLTGAGDLAALARKPLVVTGFTAEWLKRRGVDVDVYARR
ncbi:type 2 isopentenyl-diphosphate Delta-isomerase [Desulfallas sp. Bu1-1]|nr:type 2 isopentenyl-diphosphate Delta-isomerase [Desulfallas sp. Bu1-1]